VKWWQSDLIAIDTETTGVHWLKDKVFGVAIAYRTERGELKGEYFDRRRNPARYNELRDRAPSLKRVVNHHMKFDCHMLLNDEIELPASRCECTMIRAALINEHLHDYSLEGLGQRYLKEGKTTTIYQELADIFGGHATKKAQMSNLHKAPVELVKPYAIQDAILALKLYLWQDDKIADEDLHEVVALENRLFPFVLRNERRGIKVDVDQAVQQAELITVEVDRIRKQLDRDAGFAVNPNPSGSIHKLFVPKQDKYGVWRANDGTSLSLTGAGKPSFDKETMQRMIHPLAATILEARRLMKARDTFINQHVLAHEVDGYVHPKINQTKTDDGTGTGTGRLSYVDPALQQIPNRDKKTASLVRPIFLPDDGQGWSYGDLDQHELRIFHHYVNNPTIIKAYRDNPDLDGHGIVADLTGLPRNADATSGMANAKQMNLAMVFNMGGGALAEVMGLPSFPESFEDKDGETVHYLKPGPEAQDIIDNYHRMIPGVKKIAKQATTIAKSRGYVKTLKGRHLHFPNKRFVYKASGLVYQGGSADLNKENICRIFEYLDSESPDSRMLLNIHDEYSLSLPFGDESVGHLRAIKAEIQRRPEIRVPLRIDFSEPSSNWWDATIAPVCTL
jgi:DNA polymerase I-like protein with 3'-5' exonuclease and polymerase domains